MEAIMEYLIQGHTIESLESHKIKNGLAQLYKKIKIRHSISRQRRELLNLTDEQLKDIGVNREEAIKEAKKSFWML